MFVIFILSEKKIHFYLQFSMQSTVSFRISFQWLDRKLNDNGQVRGRDRNHLKQIIDLNHLKKSKSQFQFTVKSSLKSI